jgi:hypothetical protein
MNPTTSPPHSLTPVSFSQIEIEVNSERSRGRDRARVVNSFVDRVR